MRHFKPKTPKNPEIAKDFKPLLLSVHDATAMLSVSKSMVYRLIAEKQLKRVMISNSTLIPVASLEALIARQSQAAE